MDTISRQAAIDAFMDAVNDVGALDATDINTVFQMLPSVQPEPQIIRCKDCVYYNPDDLIDWCDAWGNNTTDDAFCSYAKKRRNGG